MDVTTVASGLEMKCVMLFDFGWTVVFSSKFSLRERLFKMKVVEIKFMVWRVP